MDCNREEAARAKKLAEEKMIAGDYVGAHKFITKAQRLFPDLENILHMITICDVHSSANKKISGLDNWYAILQVQQFADADAIKKQYRKLVLLLHPDKNKFAGAEAAFKLVGEAYRLLSDGSKRSQYDVRYRTHSMFASRQSNANSGRHYAAANNAGPNVARVYTFWTCCNHCGHKYKYLREYMNTVMHCSTCKRSYTAYNIGGDGVPPSSSIFGKKVPVRQNACTGAEPVSSAAEMDKNGTVRGKLNKKNQENQKNGAVDRKPKKDEGCTESDPEGGKPQKGETCTNNHAEIPKADVLKPQPEVKEPETGSAKSVPDSSAPKKNQAAKKRRKSVEEFTKSFEADGSDVAGAKTDTNNPADIPKADVLKPQPEVKEPETGAAKSIPDLSAPKKNQAAKKRRKSVEEPTKSFEVDGSDVAGAKTDTNQSNKRKSSRKKPQVSYAERGSDGDFLSPPTKKTKSGCELESDSNTKQMAEDNKSPAVADSGVSPASSHASKGKAKKIVNSRNEGILSAKDKESESCDGNGKDAASSSKVNKVGNGYKANADPNTLDIPDLEVNVFEDERKTENFAVNQIWSTLDSRDGMPRRYVRVKKVLPGEFKLRITYLEPVLGRNDEIIPVACGKFKNGKTEEIKDRSKFSVQMRPLLCNRVVSIYPRKGEIWAMFRGWNEEWNTTLERHQLPYKYDFVEIYSDFHDEYGVGVAFLGKTKGFVSLFHWEAQDGVIQLQFPPEQILRFSHKVPAVKMTGKENSFKLDPAALPKDMCQVDVVDMEMDSKSLKGEAGGSYPEAPKVEVMAEPVPEIPPSPRKRRKSDDGGVCSHNDKVSTRSVSLGEVKGGTSRTDDFSSCQVNEKNILNKSRKSCEVPDAFKLRKSPRLQTTAKQQRDEKKSAEHGDKMNTPKKTDEGLVTDSLGKSLNGIQQQAESQVGESLGIRKSPNGIQQRAEGQVGESSKKQGRNGELLSPSKQNDLPTQLDGSTNKSTKTTPVPSSCKTLRRSASNFKNQRSEGKFRVRQIWAIYSNDKRMPSEYVKIKKIETKPEFMLHVTHMELYPPSAEPLSRPASCGDFKLNTGKPIILPRDSFSHQVKPVYDKKNIVKIYPRKGEIWALYKNGDSTKEEHDIVEVVEDYCDEREMAKAVALTAKGFSSVYIIQRKQGSNSGFIDIPKVEMVRFSHQIPAIKREKRTTRLVEGEYWELDPIAIPGCTIVID